MAPIPLTREPRPGANVAHWMVAMPIPLTVPPPGNTSDARRRNSRHGLAWPAVRLAAIVRWTNGPGLPGLRTSVVRVRLGYDLLQVSLT